jgi:signal transduction histidine kinase
VNAGARGEIRVHTAAITSEQDVFALRRAGRIVAGVLGLEGQAQIRLATALSELGRDRLGSTGVVAEFVLNRGTPPALTVSLRWIEGPEPAADSLEAATRLVRRLDYRPNRGRLITVTHPIAAVADLSRLATQATDALRANAETTMREDLRAQTRDLIVALEEARRQGEELLALNSELEQTNAGVVALYNELSAELEQTNSGVVALHTELEEKSRQLREASEAKSRFWANVSHELRTPLNSVIGLARLLLAAPAAELGPEQHRQAELIAASGETLRNLVNELLDVAKAEAGQLIPQIGPVNLPTVIDQLAGMMRATAADSPVTLALPRSVSPSRLDTDETMLIRVLGNLLSNSLKFTESGEVRLEVRAARVGEPDRIEFEVRDTGVGIPLEEQQRVFEEFYQVRGPHQRGRAGTGLGLPYARRLTELLGGTLTLVSEPGQGTSVTMRLPVKGPGVAVGEEPRAAPGEPPPGRLAVLLSAEDDPAFSAAVQPTLEQLAQRVVVVDDGSRVVDAVRTERPDAVLVDLNMPGVDGYQVVERLAADDALHEIPVIVVTAVPLESLERDRLAHARAVMDKAGLTVERLADALGLRERQDGGGRG